MLSHHEDRELRAIEQWFEESDPAFTRMLRNYEAPPRFHQRLILRIVVDVLGAVLFVLGAMLDVPLLVVLAFGLIVAGVCLHLAAGGRRRQSQRER